MTPAILEAVRNIKQDPTTFTWMDLTGPGGMHHKDYYREGARAHGVLGPFRMHELPLPFESIAVISPGSIPDSGIMCTFTRNPEYVLFTLNHIAGMSLATVKVEVTKEDDQHTEVRYDERYRAAIMKVSKPGEDIAEVLVALMGDTICDILYASAGLYGVSTTVRPTKRKAAKGSGACKPLYDWHTVVLEPPKPKQEPQGGHHASPRAHDRRGHFKNYKSGKRVWFAACTVNKSKPGFIFKDYTTRS